MIRPGETLAFRALAPLQRRFLSTGGIIISQDDQITVRLNRGTYSPVLRQTTLPETTTVPWWAAGRSTTSTSDPDWGRSAS